MQAKHTIFTAIFLSILLTACGSLSSSPPETPEQTETAVPTETAAPTPTETLTPTVTQTPTATIEPSPTPVPEEMIAQTTEQLQQELAEKNASSEYVERLPYGLEGFVRWALENGYRNLRYDEANGAIAAEGGSGPEGYTKYFFPNMGLVKLYQGPERKPDDINIEQGWFIKLEGSTLEAEGVNLKLVLFNSAEGNNFEQFGETVYFEWEQLMNNETREALLNDLQQRFGLTGTVQVLVQTDYEGRFSLRSEDWSETIVMSVSRYAAKPGYSGRDDYLTLGMLSINHEKRTKNDNWYAWGTYSRLWAAIYEIVNGKETSPDEKMQLNDELDDLYLRIREANNGEDFGSNPYFIRVVSLEELEARQ